MQPFSPFNSLFSGVFPFRPFLPRGRPRPLLARWILRYVLLPFSPIRSSRSSCASALSFHCSCPFVFLTGLFSHSTFFSTAGFRDNLFGKSSSLVCLLFSPVGTRFFSPGEVSFRALFPGKRIPPPLIMSSLPNASSNGRFREGRIWRGFFQSSFFYDEKIPTPSPTPGAFFWVDFPWFPPLLFRLGPLSTSFSFFSGPIRTRVCVILRFGRAPSGLTKRFS